MSKYKRLTKTEQLIAVTPVKPIYTNITYEELYRRLEDIEDKIESGELVKSTKKLSR